MEFRYLGTSDLKVSAVGLGTSQFCNSWGLKERKIAAILRKTVT